MNFFPAYLSAGKKHSLYLGEKPNQNPHRKSQRSAWQWSSMFTFINQSQILYGPFTGERKAFGNLDVSRCLSLNGWKVGVSLCKAHVLRHPGDIPPQHPEWLTGQCVLFPGSNVCLPCLADRLLNDSRHGPTCSSSDYQASVGLKSHPVLLPLEDPTGHPGNPKRETEPGFQLMPDRD